MESSTKGQIIAILYDKEKIQKFLKHIKLPVYVENFFLNSNKIYFIDDGFGRIRAKRSIDFEDEGFDITLHSFPSLYRYILFYGFEKKIPSLVVINDKDFLKLQKEFLKSDAYCGEFSNNIEVDSDFLLYYPYWNVEFKLDKDLNYITFVDEWGPKITVPYDCDLFWWLYNKFFKGED